MRKLQSIIGGVLAVLAVAAEPLPLPQEAWRNQNRNELSLSEENGALQLKVEKQSRFDGSAIRTLRKLPEVPLVFCGTVSGSKPGMAYLQVKLYRDGKELNRLDSRRSRVRPGELCVEFDPKGADRIELLCRTVSALEYVGATARFSNFRLLPEEEFRRELPPVKLVPGYEACSIELNHRHASDLDGFRCEVSFRPEGTQRWIPALPLAYQPPEKSARGSLLNLKEDTPYQLRLTVDDAGKKEVIERNFRTLSSRVPIGRTIELGPGTELPLIIRDSGAPDGYVRYTAKPGFVLDGGTAADDVIRLDQAEYVILDGLTICGGRINGIRLDDAAHIRILNCDISGFGRIGVRRPELDGKFYEAGRALNNDAGIRIQDCRDILVERNYIHDPRGTANSWFYSHPAGPNGIFVGGTEQAVFRYNDFIGSDRHRWNDAVEGMNNGSVNGSVCRDAEIVGNYFAFGNDDGMELDGGQQNCRFLFNKSEGVLCGVSTAPCLAGPSYLVGNLFCKPGDELGFTNTAIKNNYSVAGRGKLYFLHNTMVGDWSALSSYGGKKEENEALKRIFKGYGRNNLAAVSGSLAVVGIFRAIADFDYDLLLTNQKGLIGTLQRQYNQERHGIAKPPVFVDAARGNYTLAAGSPGIGAGEPVPGLTTGAGAPSVGVLHSDLPFRPVPIHVDAARIEFAAVPAEPAEVTVTVTDPAFRSEFRIVRNAAGRFIRVTPETGTLAYGKPVKLTVSIDRSEITSARLNAGAFLIRLPDGFSRPVSVYADSTGDAALLAKDRANVIRGTVGPAEKEGTKLTADVPKAGNYYLFLRTAGPERKIPVSIDGGETSELILLGQPGPQEKWRVLGAHTYTGRPNRPIPFSAGRHTVTLRGFTGKIAGFALAEKPEELLLAPLRP